MIFAAWFFFGVVCPRLSGWIAEPRGRSIKLWCWLGAIFGPIALVAVALLPPQEAAPEAR